MRQDKYHIQMDDVSEFPVERSPDCVDWEEVSTEELDLLLDSLPEEKLKMFLGVVRNGSFPRLGDFFFRIRPRDVIPG